MSEYTEKFLKLVQLYREAGISYPNLKGITLAQWINESARGNSKLAQEHNNFGGLKWRIEMKSWAKPVTYTDHAGETDNYCAFSDLSSFIFGYWAFIGRDVYEGWELYADDPADFMAYIGEKYCPGNDKYVDNVLKLLNEAKILLDETPLDDEDDESVLPSTKYSVKFYKGDYIDRQKQANRDNCVAYVEQHFNCCLRTNGYAVAVTASNASQTSKNWGRWYAKAIAKEFNTRISGDDGIFIGGIDGRGNGNIYYTKMPAILLEPLFASDSEQAEIIRSEEGQKILAKVLAESIRKFFPAGGTVAFSVGHKYKSSEPNDRGTKLNGGGLEADYAEIVLEKAKNMLENA